MNNFKNKNILVTGGTGMIGIPLVDMLIKEKANVKIVSLDDESRAPKKVTFKKLDLRFFGNCVLACEGADYVFNLIGIKGSPLMASQKPASFSIPMLMFNTNMMEAARKCNVEKYLYTSSVGIYNPTKILKEDDVWKTFPSENDRFAGWAKRIGELQAEAYKIEYGWNDIYIVRPTNVYGPWDNFSEGAMVIPSLIKKAIYAEETGQPMEIWGDGNQIRDFIYADDVARGMISVFESGDNRPINLASGYGIKIKDIVSEIINNLNREIEVKYDTTKPTGDSVRVMDTTRAKSIGFETETDIKKGIKLTMKWYRENRDIINNRYIEFEAKNVNKK